MKKFVKVEPDFDIDKHQLYKGVFLPLSKLLMEDVEKMIGEGYDLNHIFCYELDTLTSFSSDETDDINAIKTDKDFLMY